jgi:hypothetical protein
MATEPNLAAAPNLFQRVRKLEREVAALQTEVSNVKTQMDTVIGQNNEILLVCNQILAEVTPPPVGPIASQKIIFGVPKLLAT